MSFYSDTQTPSQVAWLVNAVAGTVVDGVRSLLQTIKNRRDATILAGSMSTCSPTSGSPGGTFAMPFPSRFGVIRPLFW